MRAPLWSALLTVTVAVTGASLPGPARAAGAPAAQVLEVSGEVTGRPPKSEAYGRLGAGDRVPYGSRLRTGDDGQATLRFEDGTQVKVRAKTEVLVRPRPKDEASGVVLFFGRVWSKVVKSVGGETSFEVESANAVAGVRGTEFEVGVADDGATRVIVSEGTVAVAGEEDRATPISAGFEVESDHQGRMAKRKKAGKRADWDGWFSQRAKAIQKQGLVVAKDLSGRLDRRKAKVKKLVDEQQALRQQIEALEKQRAAGADVDAELQAKLERMEQITARLEDMKDRLEAAFGMFERWGALAEQGSMQGSEELTELMEDVQRAAKEFADMIEEGTDLSEEGMDDMLDDMKRGPTLKPQKGR
jgi:exonuclease VII small subunit